VLVGSSLRLFYAVLLEESKFPTPLVAGGHLSTVACPKVPNTAMIFVFLPRLSLFYIMTHSVGAAPLPFMRIPWPGCTQVLTVEVSSATDTLYAIAGTASDGKYKMRAWTILGDEFCSVDRLKLEPRWCSQRVTRNEAAADAAVVVKQPEWAKVWSGSAPLPAASMHGGAPYPRSLLAMSCTFSNYRLLLICNGYLCTIVP
jgi:hypothetical protein